jgi:hypothetical protein
MTQSKDDKGKEKWEDGSTVFHLVLARNFYAGMRNSLNKVLL